MLTLYSVKTTETTFTISFHSLFRQRLLARTHHVKGKAYLIATIILKKVLIIKLQ